MGYIGVRSVSNAGIQQGHDKTLSISVTKSKKTTGQGTEEQMHSSNIGELR